VSSVIKLCPKCGGEIPPDAPEGGCPGCLLESGLGLFADTSVAAVDLFDVAAYSAEAAAKAGSAKADDRGRPASPMPATARFAEMLGELGGYELLEEIGRGSQGVVFRARQKSLNRTVALKVISLGQWASTAHLKHFRREAKNPISEFNFFRGGWKPYQKFAIARTPSPARETRVLPAQILSLSSADCCQR
jgi:hypothetical protein